MLREYGGTRRGRRALWRVMAWGLHNVCGVESCPVWSYGGTQIQKEIASRFGLLSPVALSL